MSAVESNLIALRAPLKALIPVTLQEYMIPLDLDLLQSATAGCIFPACQTCWPNLS